MNAMPLSKLRLSRLLAFALLLAPAAASAQSLPKGYASDESPTTPVAASSAASTPTATAPATPVALKVNAGEDTSATATAQISTATDEYTDTDPSALTDFQEPLQGYGNWVNDDTYGTVWVPDTTIVGSDFAPYQTGGYWSLTDDSEWLWVSSYDWGYVPFHYGRWTWISGRGWSWIPGRVYAPSWVTWRTSDYGYIGWAPMAPAYYWVGGAAYYFSTVPAAAYVFCPTSYVFHTSVHSYVVHDRDTVSKIAAHSRNYQPASPTLGGGANNNKSAGSKSSSASATPVTSAKSAAAGGVSAVRKPVGPSMKEAGIPESAVPTKRSAVDSRAALFSKRSTTAKAKTFVKSQRLAGLSSAGGSPVSRAGSSTRDSMRDASRGVVTPSMSASRSATSSVPLSSQPSSRPSSVIRMPSASSEPSASRGSFPSAPSSQPVSRPSTSYNNVPSPRVISRPSAPVYHPQVSAPSVSRPVSAPRMSAPVSAPRVSAPHFSPSHSSAPHFGGGGGGHVGGGGGHHR